MNEAIIFDIDGTICSSKDRLYHIDGQYKDWDKFHEESKNSGKIENIVEILYLLSRKYDILLFTGRTEKYKELTERWLYVYNIEYDHLFMRPDDNYEKASILKEKWLNIVTKKSNIIAAFEDDTNCINMYRANGITCLEVKE